MPLWGIGYERLQVSVLGTLCLAFSFSLILGEAGHQVMSKGEGHMVLLIASKELWLANRQSPE